MLLLFKRPGQSLGSIDNLDRSSFMAPSKEYAERKVQAKVE